jgi:hypothetical protein
VLCLLRPKQQQLLLLLLLFLVSSLLQVCKHRWALQPRPDLLPLLLPPTASRRAYPLGASPCRVHPLMWPFHPQLPLLCPQLLLRGDLRDRDGSACRKTPSSTPSFSSPTQPAVGKPHGRAPSALPPLSLTSALPFHHRRSLRSAMTWRLLSRLCSCPRPPPLFHPGSRVALTR